MKIEVIQPTAEVSCGDDHISSCELISLAKAVAQIGISTQEATEAMVRLSELLARIEVLEEEMSDIRSALDDKTESPNRKDDLEIPNRIVPSENFLILEDIGWSDDLISLDKTNMFLN